MSHTFNVTTRQAVLVMEELTAALSDETRDRADLLAMHDVHQQIQHSLVYEGRLSNETPELELPIR